MLVLIKGLDGSGKSTLADRLVAALALPPVDWPLDPEILPHAEQAMGGWVDLEADYFGRCRHLDMERVVTLLHMQKWAELPPPPQWRPGAGLEELLGWRMEIFREVFQGRFYPDLFRLTCELVKAQEHAIVEGQILGSKLGDSRLIRMLRQHFRERAVLQLLLDEPPTGVPPERRVRVNAKNLTTDELVGALRREADGRVTVDPELGWTWPGEPAAATAAATPTAQARTA